jgi:hypothetical protein
VTFRALRLLLTAALASLLVAATAARADDYTDIWWAGEAESGWGVNLVQARDTIFATLFVHGPAPATTEYWYVASLNRVGSAFTGDLYQTTGTGIGAAWNTTDRTATKVGSATFTPTSTTAGTLVYNVNAVNVSKNIVRQTLTATALGGNYYGTASVYSSNCSNPARNGADIYSINLAVTQTVGGQLRFDFTYVTTGDSCTMTGTGVQQGLLYKVDPANYTCKSGPRTGAYFYQIKSTAFGIEGRWYAGAPGGCTEGAGFMALLP